MTLYYSTFYYSISSRFQWKIWVPWRFFALLFDDFWWVKRSLGRNSKLVFVIFFCLNYNFEIQFLKTYQNRQISKVFCHKTFELRITKQDVQFLSSFAFKPIECRSEQLATLFDFTDGRVTIALGNAAAFSLWSFVIRKK